MVRCIFCGMCEEVCPEQAIYLRKDYAITGFTREDMMNHKDKRLGIGGVMQGVVLKWNEKRGGVASDGWRVTLHGCSARHRFPITGHWSLSTVMFQPFSFG